MKSKFTHNNYTVITITIILMKKSSNEKTTNKAYPPYDLINYC